MKTYHTAIRQALRANPDGLTVQQLEEMIPGLVGHRNGNHALRAMPDTYIDRWMDPRRGQYRAVWCIVVPPEDCPRPKRRSRAKSY